MKDIAHHLKKLNRQIVRSVHREEMEEEAWELASPYARKQTPKQVKKQAKAKRAKTRKARAPTPLTPDERNRKMKKRVPIFDRQSHVKAKQGARKSAKKTPRI
ncbi:MAG TPA: hypothetical protein VHL30_02870 [Chlamydiales bacterium]|jgi:hypothetical protein|nr:hypothetical protein [Chlamydiales bacterium]